MLPPFLKDCLDFREDAPESEIGGEVQILGVAPLRVAFFRSLDLRTLFLSECKSRYCKTLENRMVYERAQDWMVQKGDVVEELSGS